MRSVAELSGKADVKLAGERWAERLASATFSQTVDGWATLVVHVVVTAKELEALKLSDYPATAELSWDQKALFRGNLVGVDVAGATQLALTYGDDLRLVGKRTADGFEKKTSLQDILKKIATAVEMRPRFLGSFDEILPSFPQSGQSQLDLLLALADQQGFFFVTRSVADEIVFFRPGQHVSEGKIDLETQAGTVSFSHSSEASFQRIAVRYFDDATQKPKESQLGADDLYGSIAAFTGNRDKRQWRTAQGDCQAHVTDASSYERAQSWLAAHFSKRAMSQERMVVRCHELVALPGDKLDLSKSPVPAVANGTYLVVGLTVDVRSAIPRATMTVARA